MCRNAKASPAVLDLQPQGLWLCCLLSNMGNCPGKPVSSSSTQEAQPPLATACRSHQEPPRRWQPLRGAWCGAVWCGQRAAGSFSSGAAPPWGVRHGAAEVAGGSMGERRATCAGAGTGLGLGHRAAAAMPSGTPGICAAEPASVTPWRL